MDKSVYRNLQNILTNRSFILTQSSLSYCYIFLN
nr:MAG TPA: hypothetical protein [Caudoviricetes sp.]